MVLVLVRQRGVIGTMNSVLKSVGLGASQSVKGNLPRRERPTVLTTDLTFRQEWLDEDPDEIVFV